MTVPEITAYVMALPVEELRRLTATDVMGWVYTPESRAPNGELTTFGGWRLSDDASYRGRTFTEREWRPDTDRNQSRMVTDRILEVCGPGAMYEGMLQVQPSLLSYLTTADDETRAALIAHMIHAEEAKNGTNG